MAEIKPDATPLPVAAKMDRTVAVKLGVNAGKVEQIVNGRKYLVETRGDMVIRRRIA